MVFWGMRIFARSNPVPANAVVVTQGPQASADLSRLLGAAPVASIAAVAPQASTRFKLLGVMAAKPAPEGEMTPGVALISVDGKPARAYQAGARVEDQLVVQTVSLRTASIGVANGPTSFVLEIPALPAPATGVLPRMNLGQDADPAAAPPAVSPRQPTGAPAASRLPRSGVANPAATR